MRVKPNFDAKSDWATFLDEIGDNRGQDEFLGALDTFLLSKVDHDCGINTNIHDR